MAIAFDAFSNYTGTSNTSFSWTHTPVGTPKAVIVWVVQNAATTVEANAPTYGGVTMTLVGSSVNSTGERGRVDCYFLGTKIRTGSQTVEVTVITPPGTYYRGASCVTLTASKITQVKTYGTSINSIAIANPTETLDLGGISCFCAIGFHSGQGAVSGITPTTGWTSRYEYDFSSQTYGIYTYDTINSANVACGWTQTSDDAIAVSIAVMEYQGSTTQLETSCGSGDCQGATNGTFSNTGTSMYVGNLSASDYPCKAWMPFTIDLPKDRLIETATLKLRASSSYSSGTVTLRVGCENADNPSGPTTWSDLNGRSLTSLYTVFVPGNTTAGSEYTANITNAVQQILERAGWSANNTLAVLVHDNGSDLNIVREFATEENTSYVQAKLVIDHYAPPAASTGIPTINVEINSGISMISGG